MNISEWLSSRYLVDSRSRNQAILREFLQRLYDRDVIDIIDLGSGIGSNFRYLHQRLDADQIWRFIEIDEGLIEQSLDYLNEVLQREITQDQVMEIENHKVTIKLINQNMLEYFDQKIEADAVVANAVFDLFSEEQFEQLVRSMNLPLMYFTINYNGTKFYPQEEYDTKYIDLYDQHMRRDQDFGNAMGSRCANTMVEIFNQHKYDTIIGPSDWVLDSQDRELQHYLLTFMEESIPELLSSGEVSEFTQWISSKRKQIDATNLTIKVQHDDILAIKKID